MNPPQDPLNPAAPTPGSAIESAPREPCLADATAGQRRRFSRAYALIQDAIEQRVFPGAALAVVCRGQLLACQAFGRFTYDPAPPQDQSSELQSPQFRKVECKTVRRETLWDLASLTKPIATVSMAMLLHERGRLPLDAPVADLLPSFANAWSVDAWMADAQRQWRRQVTVAMLLAHSSGLPAHRKLYLEAFGLQAVRAAARRRPLLAPPGTQAVYSDIGFIVLGELLESIAAEPLDRFCQREIFSPLNLNMTFSPDSSLRPDIPPTVLDIAYRTRIIQGEVNDENASAMGGLAPHAGLFSDVLSVARFAECLLRGGPPLFRPATVQLFTTRQPLPPGTSRTLGWDTPSPPSQSGNRFSPRSFGHLGYTGTSLWCDPDRHLSVTLLTNRTWPDSANQAIKQLRPPLHDAIVRALPKS